MVLRTFLRAAILVLLAALPFSAQADDFEGRQVTNILLRDDRGASWPALENVVPLLKVRKGDALAREDVRKGITYLYLTNQFRDIRVEAFPDGEGVRLEYSLVPRTLVEKVVIHGNHSLRDNAIQDVIGPVVGKELREERFIDMRAAIQALYQARGYYGVRVDFLPKPAGRPYRVDLSISIDESEQTIIESVRFSDNTVFRDEELFSIMTNRRGTPLLTDVLLEDDLTAIREKYAAAGYSTARPGPVRISFRDGKASVIVSGVEGPKVTVSFNGNKELNDRKLRDLLLIWSEHDIDATVIESSMGKIRQAYYESGYVDVQVSVQRTEEPGSVHLAFTVDEGQNVLVDEVRIAGNRAFSDRQIRRLMATRRSRLFWPRPLRIDVLEGDRDAIAAYYTSAGYLEANVKTTVTRSEDGSRAVVAVIIDEGIRTVTGRLLFEGNEAVPSAELEKAIRLRAGSAFSDRMVEEDRYRLLSVYAKRGYLYARVEAEKRQVPRATAESRVATVDVLFRIEEDRPVRIGMVILRGNVETRDAVILRELAPGTGETYDYESMLQSQQRIYRYGYFSLAKFEPIHPNEKEYVKDMLFTMEERPAGAVEFGIGYGDLDRLRGFAEVSYRNLWRSAHYASLRMEASDILQRAAFTYRQPWFLGFRNLDSKLLVAWSDAKRINQETREIYYQTQKTAASYGAERNRKGFTTSLTYQFENVENYNVQPAAVLSSEDSGRVLISSLNPAVVWDLRDEPFDPRRGSVHGANIKEAADFLGSEAEFTKATVQTTWFVSAAENMVVALSGRAGMAWPHRDTAEVPIHERFYLGGSTTVRGYTQDSIGPGKFDASGNRVPTGGSSMVQLNMELRIMAAGGSGFVLFTDAGNVWVERQIDLRDLRASYGAGFRYHTPVGPLRIDYGQKINRRSGESPGELHFNIGHAF